MASRKRLDLKAKRSGARAHPPLAKRASVEVVEDSDVVITSPSQQQFRRLSAQRSVYSSVLAALSIEAATTPLPKSTLSDHHYSPAEDSTSQPLPSLGPHWTALPPPNLSLLMRRPLLPLQTDTCEVGGEATTESGRGGIAASPPHYQESPPLSPDRNTVATNATECFHHAEEEEEEEEEEVWDKLCMEVDLTVVCSESPPPSSALERPSTSSPERKGMMTVGKSMDRWPSQKLSSFVSSLQTRSHTSSSSMMSVHPPGSTQAQPPSRTKRVGPHKSASSNHVEEGSPMEEYQCPMCGICLPLGTTEQEFNTHLSACLVVDDDDDDVIILD